MSTERRLAAIMFTDIVGYTALMGLDEDKAIRQLDENRAIHKSLIPRYRGQFLKEIGDGILASFNSPSDAVLCAGDIQMSCQEKGIELRIGIHQGEVLFQDGDVLGDGVNIASRIEPLAATNEILVSEDIQRNVRNTKGISTEFRVEAELKNVIGTIRIYQVTIDPVVLKETEVAIAAVPPESGSPSRKAIGGLVRWMIIGFIGVVAGVALWMNFGSSKTVGGVDEAVVRKFREMTVSVLPFQGPATFGLEEFGAMAPYWISRRLLEVTEGKVIDAGDATGHEQLDASFIQRTGLEAVIEGRYFTADNADAPLELFVDLIDLGTNEKTNIGYFTGPRNDPSHLLDQATQKILSIWALGDRKRYGQSPPRYDAFKEYEKANAFWGIDYDKSVDYHWRAFAIDTTFYDALIKVAMSYGNRGDPARQDSMQQDIRSRNFLLDEWSKMRLEMSEARLKGDVERALRVARRMTEMDPHDSDAAYSAAQYALINNKPRLALAIINNYDEHGGSKRDNDGSCRWMLGVEAVAYNALELPEKTLELFDSLHCVMDLSIGAIQHLRACISTGRLDLLEDLIDKYSSGDVYWGSSEPVTKTLLVALVCEYLFLRGETEELKKYIPALLADGRSNQAWGHFYGGDYTKAFEVAREQWIPDSTDFANFSNLAFFAVHAGDTTTAAALYDALEQLESPPYDNGGKTSHLAVIRACLGDQAEAVRLLKQARSEGHNMVPKYQRVHLYSLHGYPPFEELRAPKE